MISASGLSKSFGVRTLFQDVSLQLNAGERYGLVGANGSGKTTLLGILNGHVEATSGTVSIPKKARLGVLRQDQFLHEDRQIIHVALMGNPELWSALEEKDALFASGDANFDVDRFSELEDIVLRHDGYNAEARAAEILEGLGIAGEVHQQPLSTLSGGFKFRVLLAQVLAAAPDALLLDEPTNHLDILSIRWLEKFLRDFRGPVVVISHDHRFLDNVATQILDVDYETVTAYRGNYSDFQKAKVAERERREKDIADREREIAHHQLFVDRFRAKASKARQAQSKLKLIEKKAESLETLPQSSRRYPAFRFVLRRPSGRDVLKVRGIRKSFGSKEVLHGVDLDVRRGDRLAVIGPNGIGKSTLLKIIVGDLAADSGTTDWGYEAQPGYFAQDHREKLGNPDWTAQDWLAGFCPGKSVGFVRSELGRVLFTGDDAEKKLGSLSGGEAARLVFARLGVERPNVLLLDEPTNHLDLESIEALVENLEAYEGTLILVSHDRWFVSQLATRVVEIRSDGIRDFAGTYDEYVHACGDDHLDVDEVVLRARREKEQEGAPSRRPRSAPPAKATPVGSGKAGTRQLEQRRDVVTGRIAGLEAGIAEIETRFADPTFYQATPHAEIRELEDQLAGQRSELEGLLREWEALEEELDSRIQRGNQGSGIVV
jgi:ATPase subunit of ABC transporter with duplicated ATPase domains